MATPTGATQSVGITLEVKNSGGTYVPVGEVVDIQEGTSETTLIDASALEHTFEQILKSGLKRKGVWQMTVNYLASDSGQTRMRELDNGTDPGEFQMTLPAPASQTLTWKALVTGFGITAAVDDKISATFSLKQVEADTVIS